MNTRDVIETYFKSINSRDWDTWLSLFADDVVMDEALSGHLEGIEAMRASAAGIQQGFTKFENHVEEMVVEGNKGMVVCRIDALTASGVPVVSTGANFYRIRDGKISYMSSFHDPAPFMKAFGGGQEAAGG